MLTIEPAEQFLGLLKILVSWINKSFDIYRSLRPYLTAMVCLDNDFFLCEPCLPGLTEFIDIPVVIVESPGSH